MSFVISNPANPTSSCANRNLSGLRVIPCLPQTSSQLHAWKKFSLILSAHKRVSSTQFVFLGTSEVISSYLLVYPSPEAMYPCGAVRYLHVTSPWCDKCGVVFAFRVERYAEVAVPCVKDSFLLPLGNRPFSVFGCFKCF